MLIFVDVDTQRDFMNEGGALYVPNAESIKPALKRLNDYAVEKGIKVVKTMDVHFGTPAYKDVEGELEVNGGPFPEHCMCGTAGAKSIQETKNNDADIFRKNTYDVFAEKGGNDEIVKYLKDKKVSSAVVYGVATDYCVKSAVLGLLERGIEVTVVRDAIAGVDEKSSDEALQEMEEKGAVIAELEAVTKGEE